MGRIKWCNTVAYTNNTLAISFRQRQPETLVITLLQWPVGEKLGQGHPDHPRSVKTQKSKDGLAKQRGSRAEAMDKTPYLTCRAW